MSGFFGGFSWLSLASAVRVRWLGRLRRWCAVPWLPSRVAVAVWRLAVRLAAMRSFVWRLRARRSSARRRLGLGARRLRVALPRWSAWSRAPALAVGWWRSSRRRVRRACRRRRARRRASLASALARGLPSRWLSALVFRSSCSRAAARRRGCRRGLARGRRAPVRSPVAFGSCRRRFRCSRNVGNPTSHVALQMSHMKTVKSPELFCYLDSILTLNMLSCSHVVSLKFQPANHRASWARIERNES